MPSIEKFLEDHFSSSIKGNVTHLSGWLNVTALGCRNTFLYCCHRFPFIVLMQENDTICKVPLVKGFILMTPIPPVRTPCFPITESTTGGLSCRRWKRCFRGLRCIPCFIGCFEHILSNRIPLRGCISIPSLSLHRRGLFIVGKKNVSIHSQLPIDLWFEFTLWRFSSLQICNQPTFEVAMIVNVCKEKIQPAHQMTIFCHQFSFNCNHQRLYLFPQCDCYSFMCKTLNTNMIQKHVNGSFLLFLSLLVLLFLPVWMTWRFMEQSFFFFPTISQQLIRFLKHPIRLSRFSL